MFSAEILALVSSLSISVSQLASIADIHSRPFNHGLTYHCSPLFIVVFPDMNDYRARASEQFRAFIPTRNMDAETQSKLPEWHRVLRDIYEGVEVEQETKSRQSRAVADRGSG